MRVKRLTVFQSTLLDIVRIVAAWMVLLGHGFSLAGITPLKNKEHFLYIQQAGVVIFLILSGFLTTYSLNIKNEDHKYTFKEYVKQRAIRIYSAYIPALLFILLLDGINIAFFSDSYPYKEGFNVFNFLGNMLMLQSTPFVSGHDIVFGSGRPLWTLSIEWWNYMAFGFIFLIIVNRLKITYKRLGIAIILLVPPLMGTAGIAGKPDATLCFLLGSLAYYIYDCIEVKFENCLIILNVLLMVRYGLISKDAYDKLFYVMFFCLLIFILAKGETNKGRGRKNKVISFMAKYTYMLYLTHYSVWVFLGNFQISSGEKFLLGVTLSNIVAIGMYLWLEKPVFNLLKKITFTGSIL